jgi:hypothetical protein
MGTAFDLRKTIVVDYGIAEHRGIAPLLLHWDLDRIMVVMISPMRLELGGQRAAAVVDERLPMIYSY